MPETSGFCQVFSKDNVGLWTFLHVPAHINTVGDFQSDWRKCNPIKSSKVNGNRKKHRSVPEVFLAASAVPWVPETFLARFPVSVKSL